MNIATIMFTYNRSSHTGMVLEALSRNDVLPEKLYVFHDGLKSDKDKAEWDKVQDLIEGIDWCSNEIVTAKENKGLSRSIVDGIELAFDNYDAVIVLEDDCVPSPSFMRYMVLCLNKYEKEKIVYNIGGYAWPISVQDNRYDAYFNGRTSSWGWGTWKDRWEQYSQDKEFIGRIRQDKKKTEDLAVWGNDLENMLNDRIEGRNDSWAVFWSLMVIEKGGLCVSPHRSLIRNIGFDGTGVHCGKDSKYDVNLNLESVKEFVLPEISDFDPDVKRAFVELNGGYTVINEKINKPHALVYGIGRNWRRLEKTVNEQYWIEAFIDKNKKGYNAGKRIITIDEIDEYKDIYVIITIKDPDEAGSIRDEIIDKSKIDKNRVIIWEE